MQTETTTKIKASELRIGNYVFLNSKIARVTSLSLPDVSPHIELNFQPIPLSPEILEKCGFEKEDGLPWYEIDMKRNIGQIHINPDNGMVWLRHHRNPETRLNPMTGNPYYLHQLQNLYFALTGEELTINF